MKKEIMYRNSAVDFAYDVLDMQRRIELQEKEIDRLKEVEVKYNKLLNGTFDEAKRMHGKVLDMLLTPGVVGEIAKNNRSKK